MSRRDILDRAVEIHAAARVPAADRDPRLAAPFGVPSPDEWRWRFSSDIESELLAKSAEAGLLDRKPAGYGRRLFGIRYSVDPSLPPNSMLLEPARSA